MIKFIRVFITSLLVIKVKSGPGDDKTRVVQCLSGTANIGFGCGGKYRPQNSEQDVYYFSNCKFDDQDYENRPPVVSCAAGQQCFTKIKNFDPNGSIVEDVYNDTKGNTHVVVAEFGCGDSGRYKGNWAEYYNNKFEDWYGRERNSFFGLENCCYGDDTDGTDLWSGTDFSQQDFTCYCLDNECNRQFELPYYIKTHLEMKKNMFENDRVTENYGEKRVTESDDKNIPITEGSGHWGSGSGGGTSGAPSVTQNNYVQDSQQGSGHWGSGHSGSGVPSVTQNNYVQDSHQTEQQYFDGEDLTTEDTRERLQYTTYSAIDYVATVYDDLDDVAVELEYDQKDVSVELEPNTDFYEVALKNYKSAVCYRSKAERLTQEKTRLQEEIRVLREKCLDIK